MSTTFGFLRMESVLTGIAKPTSLEFHTSQKAHFKEQRLVRKDIIFEVITELVTEPRNLTCSSLNSLKTKELHLWKYLKLQLLVLRFLSFILSIHILSQSKILMPLPY